MLPPEQQAGVKIASMRSIPPRGAIPPGGRRRDSVVAHSTQGTTPTARRPATEPRRGRAGYYPIKTWTFEEKPAFRRLRARMHVRRVHEPDVDVHNEATQFVAIANLPGVKRENLDIDVHGDIMSIEATWKDNSGHVHNYHRELLLPAEVHDIPIGVAFENSLLEVRLKPKATKHNAGKGRGKTTRG